ncbi:MAG: response regulator [Rhizonema sp. PD37]|nr:response regulator [Rhizonema sp. PD37]
MDTQSQIILLVDDNDASRYVISRILHSHNFQIKEASTGIEALKLAAQQPDLIILDIKLPDINGFEVCRQLKANQTTATIPVLHLSAHSITSEDKVKGLEGGADGYLYQPVNTLELIATIKALLRVKEAEEKLRQSEQKFRAIFNQTFQYVGLLEVDGTVIEVNQSALDFADLELTDVAGLLFWETPWWTLSTKTQEQLQAAVACAAAGEFVRYEVEIRGVGEQVTTIDFSIKPIKDDMGKVLQLLPEGRDITARKQAQKALQESEERFRQLAENIHDVFWMSEPQKRQFIYVSPAYEELWGHSCESLHVDFMGWLNAIHPEDRQRVETAFFEKALQGEYDEEYRIIRPDGSVCWIRERGFPIEDEFNEIHRVAGIAEDISDRKLAEAERDHLFELEQKARNAAETSNRIKDEFLATLSHELRTPLNSILGWSKMLRSRNLDPATVARALETIERNAKLQTQLIEDLLDISRILRGKIHLNVSTVDLATSIEAAIDTVYLAAQAKSIDLRFSIVPERELWDLDFRLGANTGTSNIEISKQKLLVAGDSNRIQQILWNLLSNSIKFTPTGGRVEIRLEHIQQSQDHNSSHTPTVHHFAKITVSDTGKGISADFLPYVFESFRQADGSMTRNQSGLGLGLAIVRHLVELHGGTILAASLGEEQGATFTVMLPLLEKSDGENGLNSYCETTLHSQPLLGVKILIVDDESDSREFLTFMLEQYGAVVFSAATATEALEKLEQFKPDLLISDIGMPSKNGYALIREVRARSQEQGGGILAIALTAYARDEDSKQTLAAGFQRHMSKPVQPTVLVTAISSLIKSGSSPVF